MSFWVREAARHSAVYIWSSLVYIYYEHTCNHMCIVNRTCVCLLPGQLFFVTPVVDCL